MAGTLGRRVPTDWKHYEKFPLTAGTVPTVPVPVVLGVNWYSNFDNPVQDKQGRWWIGKGDLGSVRGGHCVCLAPGDQLDPTTGKVVRRTQDNNSWYHFYNQGHEGACVGYGSSRSMTLMNRRIYDPKWLWDQAKMTDEWTDTNPGDDNGTSVRAAMEVMRSRGHVVWNKLYEGYDYKQRAQEFPSLTEGIVAYRWAANAGEVHAALKSPSSDRLGAVRVLNSWGESYPHVVWMPDETLQRLIDEDGEVAIITDR
jgi:hypothetical protein